MTPNILVEDRVTLIDCTIGADVSVGYRSYATNTLIRNKTVIGRYCSIGERCTVGAAMHPSEWLTTHPVGYVEKAPHHPLSKKNNGDVKIGNDVWIGDNVIILQGVEIGDGAIIGAGAVVTKSVPAYSIFVGVPARQLRKRFPDEICRSLLALRWWNYQDSILDDLPIWDPEGAIAEIVERVNSGTAIELLPHYRKRRRKGLTRRKSRFFGFSLPY